MPVPADTTPPSVTSFTVTPDNVDIAEALTVTYSVSDDGGSGLLVVELSRANDNDGVAGTWAQVAQAAADGSFSTGAFTDTPDATGSYWYRIEVFDSSVNSVTSTSIGPIVVEPLILPASTTISPAGGSVNVATSPTFTWAAVPNASKYWITYSTIQDDLPTDIEADDCPNCIGSVITSSTSYTPSIAIANLTTYYWKVQAFNDAGSPTKQGFYSPVASFSTLPVEVTLSLFVHDGAGGAVLAGVDVNGTDASGTAFSGTTDANGLVTIVGSAGTWSFTVSKTGFTTRSWTQGVNVTSTIHTFI